jgi:hypothetical protein
MDQFELRFFPISEYAPQQKKQKKVGSFGIPVVKGGIYSSNAPIDS